MKQKIKSKRPSTSLYCPGAVLNQDDDRISNSEPSTADSASLNSAGLTLMDSDHQISFYLQRYM